MNDIIKAITQLMCSIKTPCVACGIKSQARNDADIVAIELGYKSAYHVAVEANDDAFLVALANVQKPAL